MINRAQILSKLLNIFLLLLIYFTLFPDTSFANKKSLKDIENYLQNIKNLTANFVQESEDGAIGIGRFYLSRPGKMRVEYDMPSKLLIVVNGGVLAYQDVELEETSYLRTNSTPASFLTRKKISFSAKDIEVTNYKENDNSVAISLIKKNKKEAGEFTLIFQKNPIKFLRMEVTNDSGQITKVYLEDHDFENKINKKLFIIKNNQLP